LEVDIREPFAVPMPGQFMQLLLGPTAAGTFLPRPMSVAGAARRGSRLRVSFLYAPVGTGTRALARLRTGDVVQALGPLGRGFPIAAEGTPVLIAGGRGVAPLLFVADALAARGVASRRAKAYRSVLLAASRAGPGAAAHTGGAPGGRAPGPRCEFLFGARRAPQLVGLLEAHRRIARSKGRLHLCTDDGSRGMKGNV